MVETGKTRLHSMDSRSALECNSPDARSRSCGYSSKKPGPPDGGVPARCVEGSASNSGRVIQAYQSEARSSQAAAGTVGQPISTWKPAIAAPKRKSREKSSPRAQAHRTASRRTARFICSFLPAIAVLAASGILPACKEKLVLQTVGGVEMALPAWKEHGKSVETDDGYVDKQDARGNRAAVFWDMDPRPGPISADEARIALGAPDAEQIGAQQVAGHAARLFRTMKGTAAVWRCDRTARALRVVSQGPLD